MKKNKLLYVYLGLLLLTSGSLQAATLLHWKLDETSGTDFKEEVTEWVEATDHDNSDHVIISSNFHSSDGFLFFVRDNGGINNLGADIGSSRRVSGIFLNPDTRYFVSLLFDSSGGSFVPTMPGFLSGMAVGATQT